MKLQPTTVLPLSQPSKRTNRGSKRSQRMSWRRGSYTSSCVDASAWMIQAKPQRSKGAIWY